MLLLARKAGQSVVIDGSIRVTVDRIRGRVVRLKVEAPTEMLVDREEVWNRRTEEDRVHAHERRKKLKATHCRRDLPFSAGDSAESRLTAPHVLPR